MKDFAGKVAVVTGGASGIGLALARRFAAEDMKVVIGDVERAALDVAVADLAQGGATVEGVVTDVASQESVQALADRAVELHGAIHIACNNAGVGAGGFSWDVPLSTYQWVFGVNLWGVVHGIRSFVPILMRQKSGHVVNTASLAGLFGSPFMGPYDASKHAVVGLSECLHHELAMAAPHVKVSVVCPGFVKTGIATSDRNRPAHLTEPGATGVASEALAGMLANAMPPEDVAEQVFAAIRDERFWVLTHDQADDFWVSAVNRRLESVATRSNPKLGGPDS